MLSAWHTWRARGSLNYTGTIAISITLMGSAGSNNSAVFPLTLLPLAGGALAFGTQPGDIVGPGAVAEHRCAEAGGPGRKRLQRFDELGIEACPSPRVLFRPEEIHPRS